MMKATLAAMNINDLNKILKRWRVRHFYADELGRLDDPNWKGDKFALPPKDMWDDIIGVLKLCDMIQDEASGKVHIIHCFATPAYNNVIGDELNSPHKSFQAVDIGYSAKDKHLDHLELVGAAAKCVLKYRLQGHKVGIEIHDDHIHLDVGIKNRFQLGKKN